MHAAAGLQSRLFLASCATCARIVSPTVRRSGRAARKLARAKITQNTRTESQSHCILRAKTVLNRPKIASKHIKNASDFNEWQLAVKPGIEKKSYILSTDLNNVMMAATTVDDSGTETLFSDESPTIDDLSSPTLCCSDAETPAPLKTSEFPFQKDGNIAPPNIQPFSGVLEKGKVLIRPIAFKPSTTSSLNASARFGLAGERYGSTPILTRPGSRLTLYGSSSDVRHSSINPGINNYSLDRKLRSSCQSMNVPSSPSLAMSSLSSLPHKLMNYDSLESVRKSPLSTVDGSILNKGYRLASLGTGSLLDLTPSPSDSGVSELEAALRDRDSELAYLRQTMEHNEQVIFRVYQEKERSWERELRRLKTLNEHNARTSSQRVFKLEQLLKTQHYQNQLDVKRLCAETKRVSSQKDRLAQELKFLKERLAETELNLCQKTGESSLLKSQLKNIQNEHNTRGQEALQTRNECRRLQEELSTAQQRITELESTLLQKDLDIDVLRSQLDNEEPERLKREIDELREELSEVSMSEYEGLEAGRGPRNRLQALEDLRQELDQRQGDFEKERVIWAQEKEKVLRYQRQLQMNYVQMYRRTRALEAEVESLSVELELDKSGMKTLRTNELHQTIEL